MDKVFSITSQQGHRTIYNMKFIRKITYEPHLITILFKDDSKDTFYFADGDWAFDAYRDILNDLKE